jgi:heme/copper-type cytochrome/quinol oxidase subunit 1
LTGINFLVTVLRMRAPGMTVLRMPVFVWTPLVTCVLILLAFPVLTVSLALLTLDRSTWACTSSPTAWAAT